MMRESQNVSGLSHYLGPGKIGFRDDVRFRGALPGGFPFHAGAYGLARGVVFGLFYLTWALAIKAPTMLITLHPLNQSLIYFTMARCLIRGLPVIQDGRILFRADINYPDPATPLEFGRRWA